jgi:hypothetical protein
MHQLKNPDEELKIAEISLKIRNVGSALKAKYPILKHQDFIGFSIFIISVSFILFSAFLWVAGFIPSWAVILLIALGTSILHELEHDLIHQLYFKKQAMMSHLMLFGVWIFRPLTVNPWFRKYWHIHHHKNSGLKIDIEERGITNGEKWSLIRLLVTPDLLLGFLSRNNKMKKEIREEYEKGNLSKKDLQFLRKTTIWGFLPFGVILHFVWYAYLAYYVLDFLNISWLSSWKSSVNLLHPIVILIILPNLLRQFCLHFISSNMHYYGDVEEGNIIQQTQVLNTWWTIPFHIFCFNFGATHAIHHFVVNEPFYIRQLTAAKAHEVMRKNGVRFNDVGTFLRANRWGKA